MRDLVRAGLEPLDLDGWPARAQKIEEEFETPPDVLIGDLVAAAREMAEGEEEWLEERADELDALAERLESIVEEIGERVESEESGDSYEGPDWPEFNESLLSLPAALTRMAVAERIDHPLQKVIWALADRVPRFLKFDDDARQLETKYDLSEDAPADGLGIHNFLALGGTTWAEAVEVAERGDPGWKKTYVEDIDKNLRQRAALKWGQSDIDATVNLDGSVLSILLSMQEHDFIGFDDHSDGLKAFMALRAFVAHMDEAGDGVKPIVLIDEADLHLHYDAQADLVSVFEEQDEAAKVIYTTHSAGCLPRDLGQGVRAIVPETDEVDGRQIQKDHSEAVNRFWIKGRSFSPLLLAMGAGAFAFSATQWALVTEGMSDALLLPTLVREATGEKRLRYQAVPSFAEASADEIGNFDLAAARVAFLVDSDEGGRAHAQRLTANGVSERQILFLGGAPENGLAIEDMLDAAVYLDAVNSELDAWHGLNFPEDQLPDIGRSKAVSEWCGEQSGRSGKPITLSKVDVAQRVLDQRGKRSLLALPERLREVHADTMKVFEGASPAGSHNA